MGRTEGERRERDETEGGRETGGRRTSATVRESNCIPFFLGSRTLGCIGSASQSSNLVENVVDLLSDVGSKP